MTGAATLLACDWGTTNLRAWTLDDDGAVLKAQGFPFGVGRLNAGEAPRRLSDVRAALGAEGLPAILCGMVGSNLGWVATPYADLPADAADLAAGLVEVADPAGRVRIVPGLRSNGFNGAGDVMRGEETQLFGWLAANPARRKGRQVVCHPGTHTKWMVVEEGRLTAFCTAMTGELFAVLTKHSVLRSEAAADDVTAFEEGLDAAGAGDALAARLFAARGRLVAQGRAPETASSYLSGLLIGADVAATPALIGIGNAEPVALLGDLELCAHYGRALASRGRKHEIFNGEAAAIAGLHALHHGRLADDPG
ncbi:2-dehydro-3-deoxygalactonokinase [Phenylobacterium sp.]|uniref:2-dehydro-3-deoxygalactonokinase n=1 Tax=Phenylobacterium sp. TaxID=1871053 RepID=UPI00286D4BC2|nr:2-dehydro-3-deoxygalactonokinase [Phenylobacterium sp.]